VFWLSSAETGVVIDIYMNPPAACTFAVTSVTSFPRISAVEPLRPGEELPPPPLSVGGVGDGVGDGFALSVGGDVVMVSGGDSGGSVTASVGGAVSTVPLSVGSAGVSVPLSVGGAGDGVSLSDGGVCVSVTLSVGGDGSSVPPPPPEPTHADIEHRSINTNTILTTLDVFMVFIHPFLQNRANYQRNVEKYDEFPFIM